MSLLGTWFVAVVLSSIFFVFFFLELKSFLEEQKEYWAKKLEEVEEKFLELDQCQVTLQEPKQKKRKRSLKKPQALISGNFSKFAAELQIEFFLKVHVQEHD